MIYIFLNETQMLISLLRLRRISFWLFFFLSAMFSNIYNYLDKCKPPFKQLTYLNLDMM